MRKGRKVVILVGAIVILATLGIYYAATYFSLIPQQTIDYSVYTALFGIAIIEIIANSIYFYIIKGITAAEAKTLRDLFRIVAYTLLVLLLLTIVVGIQDLTGFLVGAGFLGIVLGLAAQSTLSNFISGIHLLASKAFEPNDNVMILTAQYTLQPQSYPHDKFIPGFSGTIESIGLLYTKLINDESVPFYVPNSVVAQALVVNYRRAAKEHMKRIQFDVSSKVPFEKVQKIVQKVMKANKMDEYTTDVEYFHIDFYVVTVHVRTLESTRQLKSSLYSALVKNLPYVNQFN
ncbi:MAG: mechanosensitive ion channel [Candidatus Micrarchaeota archaeon]|nr:mechanosensitive ion channel [Candidatus Micrarchaeota archaeon]